VTSTAVAEEDSSVLGCVLVFAIMNSCCYERLRWQLLLLWTDLFPEH